MRRCTALHCVNYIKNNTRVENVDSNNIVIEWGKHRTLLWANAQRM